MDTSLAEEVQQTMATLAPNRFFFMSPYRSFTTSGCFARFDEPAVNGDSPDSPFQQKLAALFADAKAQGIKNPVMVGAIPFDPRQPSSLYIPESWQSFSRQEKQASARRFACPAGASRNTHAPCPSCPAGWSATRTGCAASWPGGRGLRSSA